MSASFREIANLMDPVEPATNMRRLAEMHQWPNGEPPTPLRLRDFFARHTHPATVRQKFLFYNTFLLPGVNLGIGHIKRKPFLRERAEEIGEMLWRDSYDIVAMCEAFDRGDTEIILKAWPVGGGPFTAYGPGHGGKFETSGLFTISTSFKPNRTAHFSFKEDGDELGDTDAHANKGVLLTEFDFGFDTGNLELYSTHLFAGGDILSRSELSKLIIQLEQVDELVKFVNRMHRPRNVIMVVGDFNIDYHVDPILSGITFEDYVKALRPSHAVLQGLLTSAAPDSPDLVESLLEVLSASDLTLSNDQIKVLQGIYREFSIKTPYQHLMERISKIGVKDLWLERNGSPGYTANFQSHGLGICADYMPDRRYCDDSLYRMTGQRIDYIFVQSAQPEHGLIVDFTRPRRRGFIRSTGAPGFSEIATMSDHLGLEVTLIVSPKPPVGTLGGMRL